MSQASQEFTSVSQTNVAAGNNYTYIAFKDFHYLSIGTKTLTNITVTVEANIQLDGSTSGTWYNVTNDLFAVAGLAANTLYTYNRPLPYNYIRINGVRTMATNDLNFDVMIKKDRS